MPETSRDLLARLRRHCYPAYRGQRPPACGCDPERGVYCPVARPDAERFAELRYAEVGAERLRLTARGRVVLPRMGVGW